MSQKMLENEDREDFIDFGKNVLFLIIIDIMCGKHEEFYISSEVYLNFGFF